MPRELVWQGDVPLVVFTEIPIARLALPFWQQSVAPLKRIVRIVPLDELSADLNSDDIAGTIYHLNRCGSTLVARQLSALSDTFVLNDPHIFQHIADHPTMAESTKVRRIHILLATFCQGLRPFASRIVIKWTSLMCNWADILAIALPKTPALFIHRNPVEVLVSLAWDEAGDIQSLETRHFRNGLCPADLTVAKENKLELSARLIAGFCYAISAACRTKRVDYRELPTATFEYIAPFFGLSVDEATQARLAVIANFHSKDRSKLRVFEPDAMRKNAAATAHIKTLADQFLEPAMSYMRARLEPLRKSEQFESSNGIVACR